MNIRVGYVPYLNMAPFYHGFGPHLLEAGDHQYEFISRAPRALGYEAIAGTMDAAPLSLADALKVESSFEPLARFGIGVRRSAQSVLLFSNRALPLLENATVAVTDETSTSFLLLQLLMEQRYKLKGTRYGRIASATLFDGEADAVLLIGDEAIKAKRQPMPGFPYVTDLGEEWFTWKTLPFVFARWMVRRSCPQDVKNSMEGFLEKSLRSIELNKDALAFEEAVQRRCSPISVRQYWDGFIYRLTPSHLQSIDLFSRLASQCSIA